jgi:hypothetical protein
MHLTRVAQLIGGLALGYVLSPLSPVILFLLRSGYLPYSPDLRSLNLLVLAVYGLIVVVLPLLIFFATYRRWAPFSWGLLIVVLVLSVPTLLFWMATPYLVNY